MPSPFPGMNPYLEHPGLWAGIHHRLITAIANALEPQIQPKYIVAIEERVYEVSGETSVLVGIPDVAVQQTKGATADLPTNLALAEPTTQPIEVTLPLPELLTEGYLEIRAVETGEVITAIEVLSPKNKQTGVGRLRYESKRAAVIASPTHLVEIDLLRQGKPLTTLGHSVESDYRILISRGQTRPKADLYAFNLPDVIPTVPIPLGKEDAEPLLNLQQLIDEIYERGGYGLRVNYQESPVPKLSDSNASWLVTKLQQEGYR
ncbi:MAG: DUF4058 family protein [Leptolyngbya sp. SIO3F4]|nr:DUF4058 family protein [Leptolyngbya sp. SIO3F4]